MMRAERCRPGFADIVKPTIDGWRFKQDGAVSGEHQHDAARLPSNLQQFQNTSAAATVDVLEAYRRDTLKADSGQDTLENRTYRRVLGLIGSGRSEDRVGRSFPTKAIGHQDEP